MAETAREWDTPLFIGEFGISAAIIGAGEYVRTFFDRLDAALASGTQWNYTPRWNAETRDGWNGEDLSIIETSGTHRANFRPRPYPRATAGIPLRFHCEDREVAGQPRSLAFEWEHDPTCGETEVFVPAALFPDGSDLEVHGEQASPASTTCDVRSSPAGPRSRGPSSVRVTAAPETIRLAGGRAAPIRKNAVDTRVRVC